LNSCTADDYETLRRYIVDGNEVQAGIENDVAAFMTQGAASWIRQSKPNQDVRRIQWRKPIRGSTEENLTILLANIMES